MVRLHFGDVSFDADTRQVWLGGEEVRLSPKAFELLALLIARRPNAVAKSDIHKLLWPDTFVSESSLPSLVSEIREAIADRRRKPALVRTLHGFGYAFQAEQPATSPAESPASAATPMARLLGSAMEVLLWPGENVIGREGDGIALVKSSTVSRRHARIVVDLKGSSLEDLGSKNGTYLNDRRVERLTPVADGDQVRFGSVLFTFRLSHRSDSTETVASGTRP